MAIVYNTHFMRVQQTSLASKENYASCKENEWLIFRMGY